MFVETFRTPSSGHDGATMRIFSIVGLVVVAMFVVLRDHPAVEPVAVVAEESVVPESSEIMKIHDLFGSPVSAVRAKKPDDALCDFYTRGLRMSEALQYPDSIWRKSGMSRDSSRLRYQRLALLYAADAERILVLSEDDKEKLMDTWENTCGEMLYPLDPGSLLGSMSLLLEDSGATRLAPTPRFRHVLIGLLAQNPGLDYAAFWGILPEEIEAAK